MAGAHRLLQLTDLHYSRAVSISMIEAAIDQGGAAQPDLICLTGDFITDRYAFDPVAYTKTLRRLPGACPACRSGGTVRT